MKIIIDALNDSEDSINLAYHFIAQLRSLAANPRQQEKPVVKEVKSEVKVVAPTGEQPSAPTLHEILRTPGDEPPEGFEWETVSLEDVKEQMQKFVLDNSLDELKSLLALQGLTGVTKGDDTRPATSPWQLYKLSQNMKAYGSSVDG